MSVVGFGAINLDKIYGVERIIKGDEEGYFWTLKEEPGGSAANTIVGLTRLGVKTGFIGKIGNDPDGRVSLDAFKKDGVDISGIKISKRGESGICHIYVDAQGQRAILINPGVNDEISPEEIDLEYLKKFDILHLSSFVCKDSDMSFETQKYVARKIAGDVEITFDPGFIYAKRGLEEMKDIIKRSKVIMLNELEIELLTGVEKNYKQGAKDLLELGVDIVVVKLGKEGCYVTDGSQKINLPAHRVEGIIYTTGAGDAFDAGFLWGLGKGKSLEKCGKLGILIASYCIKEPGARAGLPYLKDPYLKNLDLKIF